MNLDNKKKDNIKNNLIKISNIVGNISLLLGFIIIVKLGYDKLSYPNTCPVGRSYSLIKIALVFLALSFVLGLVSDYYKKKQFAK